MQVDDAAIRKTILRVRPDIDPHAFEVSEINYGDLVGFWYRPKGQPIIIGRTIALHKTDHEISEALLTELMQEEGRRLLAEEGSGDALPPVLFPPSPYEGKRGKHPNNCTCSKHLKAADGEA